jgi:hypothetical protein
MLDRDAHWRGPQARQGSRCAVRSAAKAHAAPAAGSYPAPECWRDADGHRAQFQRASHHDREACDDLRLGSRADWETYCRSGKNPVDIRNAPANVYATQFGRLARLAKEVRGTPPSCANTPSCDAGTRSSLGALRGPRLIISISPRSWHKKTAPGWKGQAPRACYHVNGTCRVIAHPGRSSNVN